MKFELDESQVERLKAWQEKIKKKHGEYGLYTFKFTPCGIGCAIQIYSKLERKSLDLSDVDKW
jgi:hypothetical protein